MSIASIFVAAGAICAILALFGVPSKVPLTALGLLLVAIGVMLP